MKKNGKEPEVVCLIPFDTSKLDELDRASITDDDRNLYSLLLLRPEHKGFPKTSPRSDHITQEEFARLVGLDPSRISRLVARRILTPAMPWRIWAIQLTSYMKGVDAGRRGSGYF
jgi:hypothetical protein